MSAEMGYQIEGFSKPHSPGKDLHEVEERAILDPGQEAKIQQAILAQGGSYTNTEEIEDVYFCPTDVTSNEDMDEKGLDKKIIRLRRTRTIQPDGKEHTATVFTTKLMADGYGDWVEANYPLEGDHLEKAKEGLQRKYDLKPFFVLSKPRTNWQLGDITISFDVVPDFGTVLEAEKIVTASQAEQSRTELQEAVRRLGVRPDQKPKTSITRELRLRYASF